MKKSVIILAFIVLFCCCAQHGLSAKEIAEKMKEKYAKVHDYSADVFYSIRVGGKTVNFTMRYVFERPNKVYVYNERTGNVIVSNGKVMWEYIRSANKVYVYNVTNESEMDRLGAIVESVLNGYDVKVKGTADFEGRKCYVLELKPKTNLPVQNVEVWVDTNYWLPVKLSFETDTPFGRTLTVVEYRNLTVNKGVNESLFKFKVPEGAEVVKEETGGMEKYESFEEAQKHVNFTLLRPKYTAGFELEEVGVMNFNGTQLVTARYTNGTCAFTITEMPGKKCVEGGKRIEIGNVTVYERKTMFGENVLEFVKNGVRVDIISGCLNVTALEKIAGSMILSR